MAGLVLFGHKNVGKSLQKTLSNMAKKDTYYFIDL